MGTVEDGRVAVCLAALVEMGVVAVEAGGTSATGQGLMVAEQAPVTPGLVEVNVEAEG